VAVAFAIGLGWLYPRGRYVFMTLAVLAAVQRIAGSAHFLSDVFWGGSLGYFLGRGIMAGWLTGGHFDRLEAKRYMATTGLSSRVESPAVQPTPRKRAA
jgi:membrane-associated phospholipid phosphatase